MCTDNFGFQLVSRQGKFHDVFEKIKQEFKPDENEWVLSDNGVSKIVTFEEWATAGNSYRGPLPTVKPFFPQLIP